MDLASLDTRKGSEHGATLIIRNLDGEPTDIEILLLGPDSATYEKGVSNIQLFSMEKGKLSQKSGDDIKADNIRVYAACTTGWHNMIENGKPVKFSQSNAERMYDQYPVVYEQVKRFIEDRRNFLPVSASEQPRQQDNA